MNLQLTPQPELAKKEIAKQIAEAYESLSRGEGVPANAAFRELDRRHDQLRRRRKRE